MNSGDFSFASDAFPDPPINPGSTAAFAPSGTPALNAPSPLLNALLLSWPARGSVWVNKLHDFLIDKGFYTVEDLWHLANGLKHNKPRMKDVFNQLVQHMSFKDADHEKMEYLLASAPRPASIFATQLTREPLVKPTAAASPSQLQYTREDFAPRLVRWCQDTKERALGAFVMDNFFCQGALVESVSVCGKGREHVAIGCALCIKVFDLKIRADNHPDPYSLMRHIQNEHLPSTEGSADEPKKRKEPFKQTTLTAVKRAAPLVTSPPSPLPYAEAVPPAPAATISAAAQV